MESCRCLAFDGLLARRELEFFVVGRVLLRDIDLGKSIFVAQIGKNAAIFTALLHAFLGNRWFSDLFQFRSDRARTLPFGFVWGGLLGGKLRAFLVSASHSHALDCDCRDWRNTDPAPRFEGAYRALSPKPRIDSCFLCGKLSLVNGIFGGFHL